VIKKKARNTLVN